MPSNQADALLIEKLLEQRFSMKVNNKIQFSDVLSGIDVG
jgi:hypothetical protein